MFATLVVLDRLDPVVMLFDSPESAENFRQFVLFYQTCGCDSSGYWLHEKQNKVDKVQLEVPRGNFVRELDLHLVASAAVMISRRWLDQKAEHQDVIKVVFGKKNGAIHFDFERPYRPEGLLVCNNHGDGLLVHDLSCMLLIASNRGEPVKTFYDDKELWVNPDDMLDNVLERYKALVV